MRARAVTRTGKPGPGAKAASGPRRRAGMAAPSAAKTAKPPVRIFVSYSHRDAEARARLETHLAPLKRDGVETWFDGDLDAGDKLDTGIARELRNAHVFVGLLSPDYLASNYCWKIEYRRAMSRRARGHVRVVAVVVRPCDWKSTPAAGFKLLPEDGREVTRWRSADAAFLDVAQGIRRVVASVRKEMSTTDKRPAAKKPLSGRKPAPTAPAKPARAPSSAKPSARTKPPARAPRKGAKKYPGA